MAPTASPTITVFPRNPPYSRHFHRLRRQTLNLFHQPPGRSSAPRIEHAKPRALEASLQTSVIPLLPPIAPTPTDSVAIAPEPSAIPIKDDQPQAQDQLGDVPGNIVAAVIIVVLILSGLVGLVVGGEMLRRQAKTTGERGSHSRPKCVGRRKSKTVAKKASGSPQKHTRIGHEKFSYGDKTITSLTRPPPVFDRERQRGLSDVWPIRSLSRALCSRRSCPADAVLDPKHSPPAASPQTTWSEFSPVLLYVAPPRTVLDRIPEESEEDCQSQTDSDIAVMLGVTFQRSPKSNFVVSAPQAKGTKSSHDTLLEGFDEAELSVETERRGMRDFRITRDEDTRSLGSSAPGMTSDGGGSSRSSMVSLESLEDGNDKESLREEVFELRRAQTRSMQMNKGVLLSLSSKNLDDGQNPESRPAELLERGLSRPPSVAGALAGGKGDSELGLGMLGGSFSAVDLDDFPSPPSILPMIPSFVSGV